MLNAALKGRSFTVDSGSVWLSSRQVRGGGRLASPALQDEGVRPYTGLALGGLQHRHELQSLQPRGGLVRLKVMIFRLLVRTKGPLFRDAKPGTLKSGRLYV